MTERREAGPDAGDPHDALLHVAVALNHEAGPVQDIGDFSRWDGGRLKVTRPARVGGRFASRLRRQRRRLLGRRRPRPTTQKFFEDHVDQLPMALACRVKNVFKLAAFVTASTRSWTRARRAC